MGSEFYKVLKSKVTWVTQFVFLGIAAIRIVVVLFAKAKSGDWEMLMKNTGISVFSAYPSGTLYFVLVALFVGGLVTSEYTTGTVKQVVSRGVPRTQIVIGQYVALSVAMTVITWIPSLLLMGVYSLAWNFGSISLGRFLLLIIAQIVVIWSYVAISMLIGHITRSGGLSVGINLIILLVGSMATSIAAVLLDWEWLIDYWLVTMQNAALSYASGVGTQCKYILILVCIGGVALGLSALLFEKRDVQ